MGCDIHVFAETRNAEGKCRKIDIGDILGDRTYGRFGFLAGVRNYSGITPISEPRGVPADASEDVVEELWGLHSCSWLTLAELLAFDYEAMTEDRRVTRQIAPNVISGGCTAAPGEGLAMTYREFLGDHFFAELDKLQAAGAERIVFGFDS